MKRVVLGPDPLDDPLVIGWDAIVERISFDPNEVDPGDMALMRRIQTLEEPAILSPTFFQDLELRLADISPMPIAPKWWNAPAASIAPTVIASPVPAKGRSSANRPAQLLPRSIHWPGRRHSLPVALAVLIVLLTTSLLVLYRDVPRSSEPPAIPAASIAEPTMEPMVELDVTPALFGMPEASTWTQTNFSLIQLDPGKSFTTDTDWYTSIDGPLLIVVLSGELTIHPVGPALLYSPGQRDQIPTDVSPGASVSLGPGAAIVYSAVDSASGSNAGSEPVTALQGSIGHLTVAGLSSDAAPIDVRNLDRQQDWEMDAPPTAGASISIQRLRLAPFDSFVFDPDPELTYFCVFDQFQMDGVRLAAGALDGLSPGVDTHGLYTSTTLTYPDPGPHTIFNFGDKTVDIYFLVIEPLSDGDTPAA